MNKKADRGQATRGQLLAIATRLFAEHGYEEASIDQVLAEAGVSRGALYYHFRSKEALFEAALKAVSADALRQVQAAAGAGDAREAFRAACLAWVRLATDPVVRRIVLLDGPAVLGWQRMRAADATALRLVRASLRALAGDREVEGIDLDAHVWLAALDEIAHYVASAADPGAAMRQAEVTIDRMLRGQLDR